MPHQTEDRHRRFQRSHTFANIPLFHPDKLTWNCCAQLSNLLENVKERQRNRVTTIGFRVIKIADNLVSQGQFEPNHSSAQSSRPTISTHQSSDAGKNHP